MSPAKGSYARQKAATPDVDKITPFGATVKQLRLAKKLSQAALAGQAGVTPGYVGLLETGQRGARPTFETAKRFAQALSADVEDTERLMRAAGYLGPSESLFKGGEKWNVRTAIETDPVLDNRAKEILLGMYEIMVRNATADRRSEAGSASR